MSSAAAQPPAKGDLTNAQQHASTSKTNHNKSNAANMERDKVLHFYKYGKAAYTRQLHLQITAVAKRQLNIHT